MTKLKKILSILLICIISIVFTIPAYAINGNDPNAVKLVYSDYIPALKEQAITKLKHHLNFEGYDINQYKWCIFGYIYTSGEMSFTFIALPDDMDFIFNSSGDFYKASGMTGFNVKISATISYDISGDDPTLNFIDGSYSFVTDSSMINIPYYGGSKYQNAGYMPVASNCKITFNDSDVSVGDVTAPPVPFTVTYRPSLGLNMARSATIQAPLAPNDGQSVEDNKLTAYVKLTDDFITRSQPISGNFVYSYQFTAFVIPSEYKNADISTMAQHSVYTFAHDDANYLYYENETLGVDDSLSDVPSTGEITPASEQWANANGISNCFVIDRPDNVEQGVHPTQIITLDLQNIDFSHIQSDTFNIVVLGHICRKSEYGWTAYPSYFKTTCAELNRESTKSFPMNFETDNEPATLSNFYDYYTVVSDDWSYKDYPDYKPHKIGNTTIGNNPLDFTNTAKGVQDYDMWSQGGPTNTLPASDFDKYKQDKILEEQANSFKFNVADLNDIFSEGGQFFDFLTASISVLPSSFISILLAFFGVMLAICLVKWVL